MTTYYPTLQTPPVRIVFEKIHPDAKAPTRATSGAAGWDVYACRDTRLYRYPNRIPTGLRVQIPDGYEIQVRPRSGLSLDGIIQANGVGTIDSDYRGELMVLLYLLRDLPGGIQIINAGERIAQLIIAPVPKVEFVEGVVLVDTERGEGGFGSTGK